MNLSYWELKTWLKECRFHYCWKWNCWFKYGASSSKKDAKAKIVILEKGLFPQGASTKNAGFACFGSLE